MTETARRRPLHTQVVEAVARSGDAELAGWVEQPQDYVLLPVEVDGIVSYDLFALQPVDVGHPLAVCVAWHEPTGRCLMTSGDPHAVYEVVAATPGSPPPEAVVSLLAPTWAGAEYVEPGSGALAVTSDGRGYDCDLVVQTSEGRRQRWRVRLAPDGSRWDVEQPPQEPDS